jgi:hypothetical protein
VTAYACYPGDHPVSVTYTAALHNAMVGFDIVALAAVAAGGAVSWWCWTHVGRETAEAANARVGASRVRFLAVWGLFSSLWFFLAILFNTIGSLTVPPCLT